MLAWVVMIRRYYAEPPRSIPLCVLCASALGSPTPSLHHFPVSPIFGTFFQVPYPVTPLFATTTKTAGVCNNSHSGTTSPPAKPPSMFKRSTCGRFNVFPTYLLFFQTSAHSFALAQNSTPFLSADSTLF